MKTVQAKFVGQHGSLGFRKGDHYLLRIIKSKDYPVKVECMSIRNSGVKVPYASFEAFLKSWDEIKAVPNA